jgi:hypothetical protein
MRARTLAGLMAATSIVACLIDRPSESLTCSTSADCADLTGLHVCTSGYCVVPNCPEDCTACDENLRTCTVDCSSADDCSGTVTCPSGWTCTINCVGDGACADVECQNGSRCAIACSGTGACEDLRCSSACRCDVDCAAGACTSMTCPVRGNGANQIRCTTDQTTATECDSTVDTRCASC